MNTPARKAVTIEIGVQNAGQSIVIAVHPLLLNDPTFAFPAMIYGLAMYVFIYDYMYLSSRWGRFSALETVS